MSYKPGDLFVGVIDLFAVFLPGAALAYLLREQRCIQLPVFLGYLEPGLQSWVAFLFVSYILGHLLVAIGSSILDWSYDRLYAPRKRVKKCKLEHYDSHKIKTLRVRWEEWWTRTRLCWRNDKLDFQDDALLTYAKKVKASDLTATGVDSDSMIKLHNTLNWAWSTVRLRSADAASEIDRTMADSKFFRSLTILWLGVPLWLYCKLDQSSDRLLLLGAVFLPGCILLCGLSWWRFAKLRWDATERIYEYYVILSRLPRDDGKASLRTA